MNEGMNLAAVVAPLPSTSGDYGQANTLEFEQLWWEETENCWPFNSQNYPFSVVSWEDPRSWLSHGGM